MNGQTEEGVCPHCLRLVDITPHQRVAAHQTFQWLAESYIEATCVGDDEWVPKKHNQCPGAGRKPVAGNPVIDEDPPAYCPL
ncbi:hypothetical protein OV450_3392 [Actinobacteria bacterium OV450]|nr:hypothetical protein OV450_3392 [Actinobacteria bacterium OV450]